MSDLFRFDCIYYYTSDLDRAVSFYTEVLGLRLESRDVVARFHINGVLFELVPTTDKFTLSGKGNARLVLAVDDINATIAHLRSRGVKVSDARPVANGLLASFYDFDSNELILWQYA
jgi:predicted enzyme related to lactoylglutathione lyase